MSYNFETLHAALGPEVPKYYINNDLGLTLTTRSNWVAYALNGEDCYKAIKWGKTCSKGLNRLNKCLNEK